MTSVQLTDTGSLLQNLPSTSYVTPQGIAASGGLNTTLYNATQAAGDTPTIAPNNQTQAYNYLDGVQSSNPLTLGTDASTVIPSLSGIGTNRLSVYLQNAQTPPATAPVYPTGFMTNGQLTPANQLPAATFESWNSAYQKEYLQDLAQLQLVNNAYTPTTAYGNYFTIGTGGSNDIHVALSYNSYVNAQGTTVNVPESNVKVIIFEQLTKTSFATMSYGDQLLITGQGNGLGQSPTWLNSWVGQGTTPSGSNPDNYNFWTATNGGVAPATALGLNNNQSSALGIVAAAIAEIVADAQTNGVMINITANGANGGPPYTVTPAVQAYDTVYQPSVNAATNTVSLTATTMVNIIGSSNMIDPSQNSPLATEALFAGVTNDNVSYTTTQNAKGDGRLLCYNDVNLFIQELQSLYTKVNGMSVFSNTDITNAVSSIKTRYNQVSAFGTVPNQASAGNINTAVEASDPNISSLHDGNGNFNNSELLTANVVSTDNNASSINIGGTTNTSLTNQIPVSQLTYASNGQNNNRYTEVVSSTSNGSTDTILSPQNEIGVGAFTDHQYTPDGYSASSNQSTIQSGYQALINAETQILGLNNQMDIIASTQQLASKQLDVPDMIFYIQLYTNLLDEQKNAAATQIVNQQNDLLNAYSQMQQLINQIQSAFNPSSSLEQIDIAGSTSESHDYVVSMMDPNNVGNKNNGATNTAFALTSAQMSIISMFDTGIGGKGAVSPIETLYNIKRPTWQFFDDAQGASFTGKVYTSQSYNEFGTSLSDAVTQINQQTQIAMNSINELDQEKNQHFSLANSALQQAQTLYTTIGSYLDG